MSGSVCVSIPNRDRPFTIAFTDETTVGDVKEYIIDQVGFKADKFVLSTGTKPLSDDKQTLKDAGVTHGATLTTNPSVPGGCGCECRCVML